MMKDIKLYTKKHMANSTKIRLHNDDKISLSDSFYFGKNNNQLVVIFELDVTEIKKKVIALHNSENISLRALVIKSIAESINDIEKLNNTQNKSVNKYYKIFVENPFYDQAKTFSFKINADNTSSKDITENISNLKYDQSLSYINSLVDKKHNPSNFIYLPRIIKKFFWKHFIKQPHKTALKKGNSILFNIGSHIKNIETKQLGLHENISIGLSSTLKRFRFVNNKLQSRDIVPVTITTHSNGNNKIEFMRQMKTNIKNNLTFAEFL